MQIERLGIKRTGSASVYSTVKLVCTQDISTHHESRWVASAAERCSSAQGNSSDAHLCLSNVDIL